MSYPAELKYSKEHEWIRVEGNTATVGITHFAQDQLGDVVMVELPKKGTVLKKDDTIGVVESVKSVSDVFSPLAGKVIDINESLQNSPGLVNEDCYGEGWIMKLEIANTSELDGLMDVNGYQSFLSEAH